MRINHDIVKYDSARVNDMKAISSVGLYIESSQRKSIMFIGSPASVDERTIVIDRIDLTSVDCEVTQMWSQVGLTGSRQVWTKWVDKEKGGRVFVVEILNLF